ncbi:hypothetical protein [Salinigranum halophilum]|uniref:hypothetical protein n=1 Tax=Salinigranum halophilum TaxID=2565931 RepID=UPI001F2F725B|nr:hypothetical protein [Salinigranum halophilum]
MLERETDSNSRTFSGEGSSRERATRTWDVLRNRCERFGQKVVFGIVVLSLVAVEPALAQNAVCDATGLPNMVSGFFQLTTGIGLIGVVVVWQANSLAEMFTLGPDQRERLKQYRRQALKSGVVLVILGPLYSVAGAMMGLPLASCIDLTPL